MVGRRFRHRACFGLVLGLAALPVLTAPLLGQADSHDVSAQRGSTPHLRADSGDLDLPKAIRKHPRVIILAQQRRQSPSPLEGTPDEQQEPKKAPSPFEDVPDATEEQKKAPTPFEDIPDEAGQPAPRRARGDLIEDIQFRGTRRIPARRPAGADLRETGRHDRRRDLAPRLHGVVEHRLLRRPSA